MNKFLYNKFTFIATFEEVGTGQYPNPPDSEIVIDFARFPNENWYDFSNRVLSQFKGFVFGVKDENNFKNVSLMLFDIEGTFVNFCPFYDEDKYIAGNIFEKVLQNPIMDDSSVYIKYDLKDNNLEVE
jgi:hypothetical protein|tara:strand:+ start:1495 stop:1878 length:384 start_codon:yes stop_codon:yes gene_type:complete